MSFGYIWVNPLNTYSSTESSSILKFTGIPNIWISSLEGSRVVDFALLVMNVFALWSRILSEVKPVEFACDHR